MKCSHLTVLAVVAAIAALPASASAGTSIGATCEGPSTTSGQTLIQKQVAGGLSYTVPPEGGIITAWAINNNLVGTYKMKLFRSTGVVDQFSVAAESEPQTTTGTGLNQFTTRIRVLGSEVLGLTTLSSPIKTPFCAPGSTNAAANIVPTGDPAVGSTITTGAAGPGTVLDLAAYIEPDADGDGFGDESQDACPINASTQGRCPVVDASGPSIDTKAFKLSKLIKGKQPKSKIEMTIGSNEAATVTLDGTLSVPGGASKTFTLKPVSKPVAANGKVKIALKVPKKGLKALRKRKKATAVVNVAAKDAAGNTSTGKFTSKVKIVKTKRIIRR